MSKVAAIGSAGRIAGFALAGVDIRIAEDAEAARAECDGLGRDVGLLIVTAEAAAALGARLSEREGLVWVTLPE